jgi:hypothetical protein
MQKKINLIAPILFLYYEESVCPLILKYYKVYFVSPLIAKPTMRSPIFFSFGKKVRVTRPTLYHEPTIKAPNIGYIKFSLPLLTGPPEIIGMWGLL